MIIYCRDKEMKELESISRDSRLGSNFVLIVGGRKVGKTTFVKEYLERAGGIYISVNIKSSQMQLNEISSYLKTLDLGGQYIPGFRHWEDFFLYIVHLARSQSITLVIDEFQNLGNIERGVYKTLKDIWASKPQNTKLNLIAVTNNGGFLEDNFHSTAGTLYHINDHTLSIKPFRFSEVYKIFQMHSSVLPVRDVRKIFAVFGGQPKFYDLFDRLNLWNCSVKEILSELVFRKFAPVSSELNVLLQSEYSKGSKVFISILQAIASGKTTVTEIAKEVTIPATSVIMYLKDLEKKKEIIKRAVPLGTKDLSKSKNGRYYFRNNFDHFWFRYVQPEIINYEMGQFDRLCDNVVDDLDNYVKDRYGLIASEIVNENIKQPEILKITGDKEVSAGPLWTRKSSFDLAFIGKESPVIKLCWFVWEDERITDGEINILRQKLAEIQKQYVNYKTELIVFFEDHNSSEIVTPLPVESIKYYHEFPDVRIFTYRNN